MTKPNLTALQAFSELIIASEANHSPPLFWISTLFLCLVTVESSSEPMMSSSGNSKFQWLLQIEVFVKLSQWESFIWNLVILNWDTATSTCCTFNSHPDKTCFHSCGPTDSLQVNTSQAYLTYLLGNKPLESVF